MKPRQVKSTNNLPSPSDNKTTKTQLKNKVKVNKSKSTKPKQKKAKTSTKATKPITKVVKQSLTKRQKRRLLEQAKREAWISKRQKKYPQKTKKELLEGYKRHQAVITSPEHKAKIALRKAQREAKERGELLRRYKEYQTFEREKLPTMRQVAWDNFNEALKDLPDEIKMDFVHVINHLTAHYGPEAVAYYLDQHNLLDQTDLYFGVNYKSMIARVYLYQLAESLAQAENVIGTNEYEDWASKNIFNRDLMEEALWSDTYSITNTVSKRNRSQYEYMLTLPAITEINLTIGLDEYFDSLDANEPYS